MSQPPDEPTPENNRDEAPPSKPEQALPETQPVSDEKQPDREVLPFYQWMDKVPGGLMLIPLVLGSIVGTFGVGFLELGSFTTALFADSALPLIALLIFATGTQVTIKTSGPVLATTGVILLTKTIIPGLLALGLGWIVGIDGILGVSILGLLAMIDNSNGGLWLAFTGRYGDKRDRGAYVASAINDGPFFTMLFLGASGMADIPFLMLLGAIIPFLLGMFIGNVNPRWREVVKPTAAIVIPFFAFALGTDIDLGAVVQGGATGLVAALIFTPFTGFLVYLGYKFLLRRGYRSGLGFAAGTTAGNAIATPAIVAAADPTFAPYVDTATAQVAAAVLVSAILAPLIASWVLKKEGGLLSEDEIAKLDESDLGIREPKL